MRRLLLILLFAGTATVGYSQALLDTPVTIPADEPLVSFLVRFEARHPAKFFFVNEWLEYYTVSKALDGQPLSDVLNATLAASDISFSLHYGYAIVFEKDPAGEILRYQLLKRATAAQKSIEELVIGDRKDLDITKKLALTGIVVDEFSGKPMVGVVIFVNDKKGTETDGNGYYKLTLTGGDYILEYSYVNYRQKIIDLKIYSNGVANVKLEETPIVLDEVVVSDQAVLNRKVSQSYLKMTDVKRAPSLLGEVDVIKQVQNQPGVTTVGEVATGFNVRGGGVDQNLVLYDGVPVFNTSHALGFFTAFNSDAVSQVSFYRGGIPAEYGGRVSSVLSITSKEGPFDKWSGGGGIGAISSYLTVGGPIKKDTTSVIASVRASYSDWVLRSIKSNYRNLANSAMAFYDASLKLTHKISERTKLNLSGYTSLDEFSLVNDSIYTARNITASAQLNHSLSEKLFSLISVNFGRYAYTVREEDPSNAFDLAYQITYPSLKIDFNYDGKHKLFFGLHNTLYDFNPGSLKPAHAESSARAIDLPNERSLESGLYAGGNFSLSENLWVEAGMRTSLFRRFGPGVFYEYAADKPREPANIVDSTEFRSGENMKTYYGIEPRLSVRYSLNDNASIKLGYNRMFQYIHLVTNTAAVTPVDIWQSGNAYFKPQVADQIALGYYRNVKADTYEAYAEIFYKYVSNVLDFKDGANLILNRHLETALLPGDSKAYGVEVSVNKVKGRLLGTLNYTYSRSWRHVDGFFQQEKINDGAAYPAHYDQPHVASLNWRYGISRRHFFTGTFTYRTGRPMSLPLSGYKIDGVPVVNFSERNLYRMPDYHRLDIAFVIEGNHKRKKLLDGTWVISFYNAYGRKNAYSVFFKDDGRGFITPYKLSVVGSIIPSVSYSFKF